MRGYQQRMAYMHVMAAVLTIQIALRRWQLNRRVSARTAERRTREARSAAAAATEAQQAAAKQAAAEEKQRKERASFTAIKVSVTPACTGHAHVEALPSCLLSCRLFMCEG